MSEKEFDKEFQKRDMKNGFTGKGSCKHNTDNDVSWYAHNEELLKSAASIPFSTTTGTILPFSDGEAVPGVMTIAWCPTLGTIDMWDPINQAANGVYSFTVHANSRNYSYAPADQMLMIIAGAYLFSFIANGIRAYGTMLNYEQTNSYKPDALVRAMGFDPVDLRNNLSHMWFDLNDMIARSRQIWIPNTMPVVARWFWMNSNIYMDSETTKGQYYLYAPAAAYYLSETGSTTGTAVMRDTTWISPTEPNGANTWATFNKVVNNMFDKLIQSEDRGTIFGDMMKAYGADRIYSLSAITSDYAVQPSYNQEVLSQIENAMCATNVLVNSMLQDENGLIYETFMGITGSQSTYNSSIFPSIQILNFHQREIPSPAQIMVATRMKSSGVQITKSGDTVTYAPATCGTEIATGYAFFQNRRNTNGAIQLNMQRIPSCWNEGVTLGAFKNWMSFDWAPWIYEVPAYTDPDPANVTTGNVEIVPVHAYGDYDFYTTITTDELKKMHRTALYSEFGVPNM